MTNHEIAFQIIHREGGWELTDTAHDRGGVTYGGMTLRTLNAYRRQSNQEELSPDTLKGLVSDESRVRNIRDSIVDAYIELFIEPYKPIRHIDNGRLVILLADTAVMSGTRTANKLFQQSINMQMHGNHSGIVCDGVIGPNTLNALCKIEIGLLKADFTAERIAHYGRIIQHSTGQAAFIVGWLRRAMKVYRGVI